MPLWQLDDASCEDVCASHGWTREKYRKVAQRGRGRLRVLMGDGAPVPNPSAASEQAPKICQDAMGVCGIVGYKNDTPFSVGRHLRDAMSAVLMVANERIHQTNASLLLIAKDV